jgi:dTMP kinase
MKGGDMKKGRFIVLEGVDGSGKGTVIKLIKEQLPKDKFLFTREPGGTEAGAEIREVLLKMRESELSFKADMLLYLADRVEHLEKVVVPAIREGKDVFSDRYEATLNAYQIHARGNAEHEHLFYELKSLLGIITPDLYIFLDQDPEISYQRANQRPDERNRFDVKEIDFYVRAREAYLSFMKQHNSRVVYVGPTKTPEQVTSEVLAAVKNFLEIE